MIIRVTMIRDVATVTAAATVTTTSANASTGTTTAITAATTVTRTCPVGTVKINVCISTVGAISAIGSVTTIGFHRAFTLQVERTACGQFNACTSTGRARGMTATGCKCDALGDVEIYSSTSSYGQTAAGSAIGKSHILINIVMSLIKGMA